MLAALPMMLGLASCSTDDNPVIDNPDNPTPTAQKARYTVLVYGNAGGEMDYIVEDTWEMIRPLLTDSTNVRMVFFYKYGDNEVKEDGKHSFTGKYAEPGDLVMFELNSETDLLAMKTSEDRINMPDLPLYNPIMLASALETVRELAPAEEYILLFYGHGSGFDLDCDYPKELADHFDGAPVASTRAILYDELIEGASMNQYEVAEAVRMGMGSDHLKCIYFHDCLMGNLESLTQIEDCADYFVTSEHVLESYGEPIKWFVETLQDNQLGSFEAAAKAYMDVMNHSKWATKEYYTEEDDETGEMVTYNGDMSVTRANGLKAINEQVKRLGERLIALYPTQKEALDEALTLSYQVEKRIPEMYDVCDYADHVARATGDPTLTDIAERLRSAIHDATVGHANLNFLGEDIEEFTLSITVMDKQKYNEYNLWGGFYYKDAYEYTALHQQTGWGAWLDTNEQRTPKVGDDDYPELPDFDGDEDDE